MTKCFLKGRSEFMKVHGLPDLQINSWLIGNNYSQIASKPISSIADSDESGKW